MEKKRDSDRSTKHSKPSPANKVHVAIDFETYDLDLWWTFGVTVSRYPEGSIEERFEIGVDRSAHPIATEEIRQFWARHPEAFQKNLELGSHHPEIAVAEKKIAQYIDGLKKRFPDFFLISDSPAFDVRLLDNLLARQQASGICFRASGYLPCICVWSHRLALMQILGIHSMNTVSMDQYRQKREIELNCAGTTTIPHTPLSDTCLITRSYFWAKDLIRFYRTSPHRQ